MKSLFIARSRREQYMVILFLLTIAVIWAFNLTDRAGAVSDRRGSVARLLTEQQVYLDDADEIEARMQEGIANLDPERTLDPLRLQSELNAIARRYDIVPDIATPASESGDVFSYHSVRINVSRAQMDSLIRFARDVQQMSPYLGLEEVANLRPASGNDPRWLQARFTISSVELTQ